MNLTKIDFISQEYASTMTELLTSPLKKMGDRTQHEGKTERAKESHDRCSQPPGTQALLVVNSFKLHLNSLYIHFR